MPKFSTNIPITAKFPFGDYKEVTSEYGPQFMYTVEVDGQRDRLFATPRLHQQLQEAQVKRGAVFTITKIEEEGNRKDWKIQPQGQNGKAEKPASEGKTKEDKAPTNGKSAEQTPAASSKNGAPPADSPDFHDLKQAMQHCIQSSYEVWERLDIDLPFTSEDVRCVGITLFLECSRKGIVPQASGEALPF